MCMFITKLLKIEHFKRPRAKKSLIMNETLVNLLRLFGEPFVTIQPNQQFQPPTSGAESSSTTPPVPCVLSGCDKTVPSDNSWVVGRPEIDIRVRSVCGNYAWLL